MSEFPFLPGSANIAIFIEISASRFAYIRAHRSINRSVVACIYNTRLPIECPFDFTQACLTAGLKTSQQSRVYIVHDR